MSHNFYAFKLVCHLFYFASTRWEKKEEKKIDRKFTLKLHLVSSLIFLVKSTRIYSSFEWFFFLFFFVFMSCFASLRRNIHCQHWRSSSSVRRHRSNVCTQTTNRNLRFASVASRIFDKNLKRRKTISFGEHTIQFTRRTHTGRLHLFPSPSMAHTWNDFVFFVVVSWANHVFMLR